MIKFFRKIRQKLLQEDLPAGQVGKILNYLKYALGEILLVVIGILIALQVNNWNENRKTRMFEQEIISLIDKNLTRDSVLIAVELQHAILANQLIDSILYQVDKGIFNEKLNGWMGKVVTFERFKSQSSGFEVLKSKGMEAISDKNLQVILINYYDETLFKLYQGLFDVENFFNNDWIPVIKKEFNDFEYRKRLEPMDQRKFFENPNHIILFKLYKDNRQEGSIRRMEIALQEISSLKTIIKNQKK